MAPGVTVAPAPEMAVAPDTTAAPDAPETTSAAPETTAAAPETPAAAPLTTAAATETTATPQTTAAPETAAAPETNAAPETTTIVPGRFTQTHGLHLYGVCQLYVCTKHKNRLVKQRHWKKSDSFCFLLFLSLAQICNCEKSQWLQQSEAVSLKHIYDTCLV